MSVSHNSLATPCVLFGQIASEVVVEVDQLLETVRPILTVDPLHSVPQFLDRITKSSVNVVNAQPKANSAQLRIMDS